MLKDKTLLECLHVWLEECGYDQFNRPLFLEFEARLEYADQYMKEHNNG